MFNHDHQKGPENILGEIEDADFIDHNNGKALFVKGYLFKHQDRAKAYYNIMKSLKKGSNHRVHFSIEGKILQRSFNNPKHIAKARIDKVALTLDPVNPITYCSFAKSLAFINEEISKGNLEDLEKEVGIENTIIITKEDVLKTLAAGAGYTKAPEARTNGEALQKESMDSKLKKISYDKKKNKKEMLKSIIDIFREEYPGEDPLMIAKNVISVYKDLINKKGK